MAGRILIAVGIDLVVSREPQVFLVFPLENAPRVVELRDDEEIRVGTTRFRRRGNVVQLDGDACVNGAQVTGPRRLEVGDQIEIGPVTVILGTTRGCRKDASAAEWVANDPVMRQIETAAERIATSASTVLLLGERGVGKERLAELIDERSARRTLPFTKVISAELTEAALETQLGGARGTLYFDDIAALPLALQGKLLRVLERQAPDVRVIAATDRDLRAEVRAGRFRQDLLFRIGGFTLSLPPLRDRPSDILPLAEHFAGGHRSFAADARMALVAYSWPGNLDELAIVVERSLGSCGPEITARDLGLELFAAPAHADLDMRTKIADVERAAITSALAATNGNQTHAARALGLSRRTLIYRMEKYGLKLVPAHRTDVGP